jgi:hypothetical protein
MSAEPEYNPYAAPTALGVEKAPSDMRPQPKGSSKRGPQHDGSPRLKWIFLGLFGCAVAFNVVTSSVACPTPGEGLQMLEARLSLIKLTSLITLVVVVGAAVVAYRWIYRSWGMLPEHERLTRDGKQISPGGAVARCFIPFYNLYWYPAMVHALARAIDKQLLDLDALPAAPSGTIHGLVCLYVAAVIENVISKTSSFAFILFFLLAMFVWFRMDAAKATYYKLGMARIERRRARREAKRAAAESGATDAEPAGETA